MIRKHPRSLTWWTYVRYAGYLFPVLMIIVIAVDYFIWHRAAHRIHEATQPIVASRGSIGGWPLGLEYYFVIERPITDNELHQLEALNHPPRMSYIGILFRTCEIDQERLDEIRNVLSECGVNQDCDAQDSNSP